MHTQDRAHPLPTAGFGRALAYVVAAAIGALAILSLVTGAGTAALVFGAFAASLTVVVTDTSPVLRVLAAIVAVASGVVSLALLTVMLVFMTGDI